MSEKLTTLEAVARLERGLVVWRHECAPLTLDNLTGMVANSELVKCEHAEFSWFFAWKQLPSESIHDKAFQMLRAARTSGLTGGMD